MVVVLNEIILVDANRLECSFEGLTFKPWKVQKYVFPTDNRYIIFACDATT
jgi:hypothetical protein